MAWLLPFENKPVDRRNVWDDHAFVVDSGYGDCLPKSGKTMTVSETMEIQSIRG